MVPFQILAGFVYYSRCKICCETDSVSRHKDLEYLSLKDLSIYKTSWKFPVCNSCFGVSLFLSSVLCPLQVDKVTGRFNGQFKTYAICGAIRRMVSLSQMLRRTLPAVT